MARELGGRFLLRIEDIDSTRCRPEFSETMLEDLTWLGLDWEQPVLRQSEHRAVYRAAAARLREAGLLYPCFATRSEIAAAAHPDRVDPDGAPLYPGLHRNLERAEIAARMARGEPYSLRLDMARALERAQRALGGQPLTFTAFDTRGAETCVTAHPQDWGDPVIVRKEFPASYHLAVVVDDARQGVTHVTRGMDLYRATDLHRLLQVLLGLPEPKYHHHDLMLDQTGRKFSKRDGDLSLRAMRLAGETPDAVRRKAGCRVPQ